MRTGAATSLLVLLLCVLASSNLSESLAWSDNLAFRSRAGGTSGTPGRTDRTIPDNVRLLILPGFGNDSKDYYLDQAPQGSLVGSLKKRGWKDDQIKVLPISRTDWLNVFVRGAFDLEFWRSNADPTRQAFRWYLDRIAASVRELVNDGGDGTKVCVIGHSAGGWIARSAIGFGTAAASDDNDGTSFSINLDDIVGIVTLGAPNLPPPAEQMDMTRGALRITNENFPGAFHEALFYITVVGEAIVGKKQERKSPFEPTTADGFAFESYVACSGVGDAIGDGVVPASKAHLPGATQITLDDVYHSINVPNKWYGSDSEIDRWHDTMIVEINRRLRPQIVPSLKIFEKIFQKQQVTL